MRRPGSPGELAPEPLIGDTQTVAYALAVAAAAVAARGDLYATVTLAAADDALCATHRFELGRFERELVDEATQSARQALGDKFEQAWQAGGELASLDSS
jgi:hypothetical protein